MEPLVNTKNHLTEAYINPPINKDDDYSNQKKDLSSTKYVLNKQSKDLASIINKTGARLTYIKSGATGQTFRAEIELENNKKFHFAVKVCAYPKKRYGSYKNINRPENAEIRIIKALSYFVVREMTPHIVLPYITFDTDIKPFVGLEKHEIVANDKVFKKFIENYRKGRFFNKVSILMSEWANKGDLLDFVRKHYLDITLSSWKNFFFQILSVLAIIQTKYPGFRHNDLKPNNILIHKRNVNTERNKRVTYIINNKSYYLPKMQYQLKLWDFDFACIPGVIENEKVNTEWTSSINVNPVQNRYYDVHYFFNTFLGFFSEQIKDGHIPKEVVVFIDSIVPDKLRKGKFLDKIGIIKYQKNGKSVSSKGKYIEICSKNRRLLKDIEYTTPSDIIETNPFFKEYRVKPTRSITNGGGLKNKTVNEKKLKRHYICK
jgi:serine/threonine protein kinase